MLCLCLVRPRCCAMSVSCAPIQRVSEAEGSCALLACRRTRMHARICTHARTQARSQACTQARTQARSFRCRAIRADVPCSSCCAMHACVLSKCEMRVSEYVSERASERASACVRAWMVPTTTQDRWSHTATGSVVPHRYRIDGPTSLQDRWSHYAPDRWSHNDPGSHSNDRWGVGRS